MPSGAASLRLFDLSPKLAVVVIRAHIEAKRAELEALNLLAWREAESV